MQQMIKQYQATMQGNDATHQNNMYTDAAVSIHEEYESNFEFRPKTMNVWGKMNMNV